MSDQLGRTKIRARLFGPFQIDVDGRIVEFPNLVTARLVAFVLQSGGFRQDRTVISQKLWPDFEVTRQKANLRTALNAARKSLGEEIIHSDRDTVWIDPQSVTSDLQEAELARKTGALAIEFDEQAEALVKEIDLLKGDYLQGWSADWIDPIRTYWDQRRTSAMIELALLSEKNENFQRAEQMARSALDREPFREDAISCLMRIMARQGRSDQAVTLYEESRTKIQRELDVSFSPVLANMAEQLRTGTFRDPFRPNSLFKSAEERDLLVEAVESSIQNKDGTAVNLIAANPAFWAYSSQPEAAFNVVSKVLEADQPPSDGLLTVCRVGAVLALHLSRYQLATRYIEQGIAISKVIENKEIEGSVLAQKSFLEMEQRLFEASEKSSIQALNVLGGKRSAAQDTGRINYAGLLWHVGRIEEAKEQYALAMQPGDDYDPGQMTIATCSINLSCIAVAELDWEEGLKQGSRGESITRVLGYPYAMCGAIMCIGACHAALGNTEKARAYLTEAVHVSTQHTMFRIGLVVLDHVVIGLAYLGQHQDSLFLAEAVAEQRATIGHHRSPTEQKQIDRLYHEFYKDLDPPKNPLLGKSWPVISAWTIEKLSQTQS